MHVGNFEILSIFSREIRFKNHLMTKTSNKEANTGIRSLMGLGRKRSEIKYEIQPLRKTVDINFI